MPKQWLTEEEAREYLASRKEGRLATVDGAGQPYITPLNYIYYEDKIYFHCALQGRKLANLKVNSMVCFEVSHTQNNIFAEQTCKCSTRYTSVLVFGEAQVVEAADEKTRILNVLSRHFAAGRPWQPVDDTKVAGCLVVVIQIRSISGKSNVDVLPEM